MARPSGWALGKALSRVASRLMDVVLFWSVDLLAQAKHTSSMAYVCCPGRSLNSQRRLGVSGVSLKASCRLILAPTLLALFVGLASFSSPVLAEEKVDTSKVRDLADSIGKAVLRSAQTLVAAGVREDGIHAATITIDGVVTPGTDFDPDNIAELFWTAHTDPKDAWQTEYRFTGA